MLKIIDLKLKKKYKVQSDSVRPRNSSVENTVALILNRVQEDGDEALRYFTKKFDGVVAGSIEIPPKEIALALKNGNKNFIRILKASSANIRRFHSAQIRKPFTLTAGENSTIRQIYRPIEKVGVYVPGGKAAYPSTVLMNVIPAQVAGVREIHLVSPPDAHGNIHPDVLLAASLLGIKHIYRVGGAQAIAALAFGTETIPAVDKIVGPGNVFVATAKRLVFGTVGIDNFAGPSEVVILADASADAAFVAADLLAQAEHDEQAVAILVTTSRSFADTVNKEIKKMSVGLERKSILDISLKDHGRIYLVSSLQHGIEVINQLAPEHLEIVTSENESVLRHINHAGSIFLGNYSPVAIGDYFAGPNHVLPTGGTARFSSPLSVDDFMKRSSVIQYSQKMIESLAEDVSFFAEREGLTAHALSLKLRKNRRIKQL